MAICNKKQLFLVVRGVEISITDTPWRISDLEDFLLGLYIPRDNTKFTLDIDEFSLFQKKFEELLRSS